MKKIVFVFSFLVSVLGYSQTDERISDPNSTMATCSPNPCSYVSNGDFESATSCGFTIGTNIGCWQDLANSPDIFSRGCSVSNCRRVAYNTCNNYQCNYDNTCTDTYSGSGTGNDKFIGLNAYKYASGGSYGYNIEAAQTQLGTSLVNGQQYVISFWAKVNKNADGNGPATNIPAQIDFHALSAFHSLITAYTSPIGNIITSAVQLGSTVQVPNDDVWHYIQRTITYTGPTGYNILSIAYNPFVAPFTSMTTYDAYVYLDDITFNQLGGIPIVSNPPPVCSGQTIPNLNAYVSIPGGVFSGAGVVNNGGGVYSFNPGTLALGNHTVFYTYTSGTCVYHQAIVVTLVNGNISASLANQTICANACANLVPTVSGTSPFTYSWSNSSTASSINVCPAATTSYQVQVTNAVGCVANASSLVTVTPLPVLSVSNSGFCPGGSTVLSVTGATTYNWASTPGLSCYTCSNPIANPTSTTIYAVTGTTNGCSSTKNVTVSVYPVPASFSVNGLTICAGSSGTMAVTPISSHTSYSWLPATGLNTTIGTSVIASPPSTTVYNITAVNTFGCSNSASTTVVVNPLPTIVVPSQGACLGESVTLNASGAVSYVWSPSSSLSSSTGSSVVASPALTTLYTITGTGSNGCVNSTTASVTLIQRPEIRIGSVPKSPQYLQPNNFYSSATGNSYNWSASTALLPSVSFSGQGTNSIGNVMWGVYNNVESTLQKVTLNLDGCTTSLFIPLNSPTGPKLCGISGPTTAAPGSTQVYSINCGAPLYSGAAWFCDGGTILSGQGTSSITVKWGVGYVGRLGFQAANSSINAGQNSTLDVALCSSTAPVNPTNNSILTPNPIMACASWGSLHLNAGNTGSTYLWSTGSTSQVIAAPVNSTGYEDNFYVTITNTNGCKSTFFQSMVTDLACRMTAINNAAEHEADLLFYPNPSSARIFVEALSNETIGEVVIRNFIGDIVYQSIINSAKQEIDISNLPAGVYTLYNHGMRGKLVKE